MRTVRSSLAWLAAVAITASTPTAFGDLVIQTNNQIGPGGASFTPSYVVSTTDLLHLASPTASSGNFTLEAGGGLPALTNGTFGTIFNPGGASHPAFATAGNGGGSGTTLTYALTGSAQGYNLTGIDVYGGWNDNGRDQQHFNLLYSTVAAPSTFVLLGTVDFNPAVGGGLQSATRVSFFDDLTPVMVANVAALRFDFLAVENGYTGYAEIDAFGAAVPEPSTYAMLGLASASLLYVRRRKLRKSDGALAVVTDVV